MNDYTSILNAIYSQLDSIIDYLEAIRIEEYLQIIITIIILSLLLKLVKGV